MDRPHTGQLWLVTNGASGGNSAEAVRAVTAALARAGQPVARQLALDDGMPSTRDLAAAGVAALAVFGGDGTVNGLATRLEGWDGALLVLPGGTANLLARTLHGARSAEEIAGALGTMRRLRRPCIRWEGGAALIEVLAGPGATWSDVREELRDGAPAAVAGAAVSAIRHSTTGPMVRLSDPPLGKAEGYSGVRFDLSGAGMAVEGYGADTVGDYLRQGLALLRRNYREGPHEDLGTHAAVTCRSLGGEPIPLMIDGERREGGATLRFSLAPFALDLLVSGP